MRHVFPSVAAIPILIWVLAFPSGAGAMGAKPGAIRLPAGFHLELYSGKKRYGGGSHSE